ncbi:MAG: hypothetical protein IJ678_08335 [Kiritimatiellae bacterium]|nr:hypothetical protein [Kiritimatiellia bacterium]
MFAAAAAAADPDAVVHVSLVAPGYTAANAPVMPPVKFGKAAPLCMISDDMSLSDYCSTWALFNGYPHSATTKDRQYPRGDLLLDQSVRDIPAGYYDSDSDGDGAVDGVHEPLTFSDGAGLRRRFAGTSAVFAYTDGNYLQITPDDVRTMSRTGWACTFHDVDVDISAIDNDPAKIAERFAPLNERWKSKTGYALKLMVEPNGNKSYMAASIMSGEIAWPIFQNSTSEYPAMPMEISAWTDRAAGIPSSFDFKPQGGFARIWAQGYESNFSNAVNAVISSGRGTRIILGGTHGVSEEFKRYFAREILESDLFWVASADEIWEYYWLWHNVSFENLVYDEASQRLEFDVRIPAPRYHQFREISVDLPGLTGVSGWEVSGAVTANAAQNGKGFSMNLGVEEHVLRDADALLDLREQYGDNPCIRRDAEYLVSLLAPGPEKEARLERLRTEWNYTWTVRASTGELLESGKCNSPTNVSYAVPLFVLHGNDLYRLEPDVYSREPLCGGSAALDDDHPSFATNWQYTIREAHGKGVEGAAWFAEGEDLYPDAGSSLRDIPGLSMRAAGDPAAVQGGTAEATRLPPGRYKFGYRYYRPSGAARATWTVLTNGVAAWSASNGKNETSGEFTSPELEFPRAADVSLRVAADSGGACDLVDCVWFKRIGDIDTAPAIGTVSATASATAATLSVAVDSLGYECSSATVSATLGGTTKSLDVTEEGTHELVFDGLDPATEYAWSVSVVSDGGEAVQSGTVTTEISRPAFSVSAAPVRIGTDHSVTLSVSVDDFGPGASSAEITASLGGRTETRSVSETGAQTFVFDGLAPETAYRWSVAVGNGIGTDSASGSVTTRPRAIGIGSVAAQVADDQLSATLTARISPVDSAESTVTLWLDGVAIRSWYDLDGPQTVSQTVEITPGRTYSYSFEADADGETATASGSFAAYVITGFFNVRWIADAYPEGEGWDADPAAQERSGGVWSRPADAEASLAGGRLSYEFKADGTEGQGGALAFYPAEVSDGGEFVVEGVVDAREGQGLMTEPAAEPLAGLVFVDGGIRVRSGGKWVAADTPVQAADGLAWRAEFDFTVPGSPRVRYSVGGTVVTAGGEEWLASSGSDARGVSRVEFRGRGAVGDFRGFARALVSEPVEIPAPVFASGGALGFAADGGQFTVALDDTDAGFWYGAFAAETLDGPFVAEADGVPGTGGRLVLSVEAGPSRPSRFVKICVSRVPCRAGETLEQFLSR